MYDTRLIYLKVNLTLLNFLNSLSNIHSYSTTLGVRHQATGTQYTTEGTNLTHDRGHSDDNINICPSTLDLLNIFIETNIVSTCFFSSSLLVRSTECEHTYYLTGTIGKRYYTTNHLICLTGVNAQTYVNINRSVKLGSSDFLHQACSLFQGVYLTFFNLGSGQLLIFCQFTHSS